jgi:hypothetical protein
LCKHVAVDIILIEYQSEKFIKPMDVLLVYKECLLASNAHYKRVDINDSLHITGFFSVIDIILSLSIKNSLSIKSLLGF